MKYNRAVAVYTERRKYMTTSLGGYKIQCWAPLNIKVQPYFFVRTPYVSVVDYKYGV